MRASNVKGKSNMADEIAPTVDVSKLTTPAQEAMARLALEAERIEALMGDMPPRERAYYLSNLATQQTFSTLNDKTLARDFGRMIESAAVAMLTAALVL